MHAFMWVSVGIIYLYSDKITLIIGKNALFMGVIWGFSRNPKPVGGGSAPCTP